MLYECMFRLYFTEKTCTMMFLFLFVCCRCCLLPYGCTSCCRTPNTGDVTTPQGTECSTQSFWMFNTFYMSNSLSQCLGLSGYELEPKMDIPKLVISSSLEFWFSELISIPNFIISEDTRHLTMFVSYIGTISVPTS